MHSDANAMWHALRTKMGLRTLCAALAERRLIASAFRASRRTTWTPGASFLVKPLSTKKCVIFHCVLMFTHCGSSLAHHFGESSRVVRS